MQQPGGENVTLADTGEITYKQLPGMSLIAYCSTNLIAGLNFGLASTSGRGRILDPFCECLRDLSDLC